MDILEDIVVDVVGGLFLGFFRLTGELLLYGLSMGSYERGQRGFVRSLAPVTLGLLFWVGLVWLLIQLL